MLAAQKSLIWVCWVLKCDWQRSVSIPQFKSTGLVLFLKNRQVWCLVKMHNLDRWPARVFFSLGWLSCGFIPISSSRSSTSSSRCRMLHWKRKSRLWPQRQSGESRMPEFWSEGPKKSWGFFKGTRFQRSWSWMLSQNCVLALLHLLCDHLNRFTTSKTVHPCWTFAGELPLDQALSDRRLQTIWVWHRCHTDFVDVSDEITGVMSRAWHNSIFLPRTLFYPFLPWNLRHRHSNAYFFGFWKCAFGGKREGHVM